MSVPAPGREAAFSEAEYEGRLRRARAAMADEGIDLLLVHSLPNICYLTGFQTPLADWYHCLVLPLEGEPALQLCDTELAALNSRVARIEGVLWEHMEEAGPKLLTLLADYGAEGKRIGLELRRPGLTPHLHRQLAAGLPRARLVDASDLVAGLRVVKSAAEIACMREAARISAAGMVAGIAAVRPGASENSVTAAASAAMFDAGSEYFSIDPIVRAGRRSSVIHGTCKREPIARGDAVFMEFGGVYQRYCAPLIRTAVLGPPSDEMCRLADQSLRTLEILYATIRPGLSMHEVAATVSAKAPALAGAVRTRGYYGYSVGIGFPPVWVEHSLGIAEGTTALLAPGMTFHTHRSLRVPGRMTVAFSETILVTEAGCEPLSALPRELAVR